MIYDAPSAEIVLSGEMNFEAVKAWYTESVRRRIRNCRIASVVGILLMPLALALAAGLIFGILHGFGGRREEPMSVSTAVWISLAVIPVMFIGNRCVPRESLMDKYMGEGGPDGFTDRYRRRVEVYVAVITWILFAGPRLLDWSIDSLREQKRLKTVDIHSCSAVLWLLLARYKKVPYDDIQTAIPWLDMDNTIPQVMAIPGVVALTVVPAGLSLTQDMRDLMRAGKYD